MKVYILYCKLLQEFVKHNLITRNGYGSADWEAGMRRKRVIGVREEVDQIFGQGLPF
jgi:hypothetical protein